jgi:alkylation response protein AidB-like acyl-CoA dehydrogenase
MILEPSAEQLAFAKAAESFAEAHVAPIAPNIDEHDAFPRELIREAGRMGLTGVTIPRAWGGAGRDYVSYVLALEAIARQSATVAVILMVENSLVAETIQRYGTEEQKARWLRPLADGESIGAFALSEDDAGTDAANQRTRVTMDGFDYRLNGRKVWVANAAAADVAVVFGASQPDLTGKAISAFLVPMDTPGIVKTTRNDSVGVRGLGCMDLEFRDVEVDSSQMLGTMTQGWKIARWALEGGRIAIAAQALGVGRAALDEALAHAKRRHTFGQPIANYQAIQWMLADMATELDAARMLTLKAACAKDTQPRCALEASMAKLLASESAHRAVDKAMQILASAGYRRGSKVERLFRDVRAAEIYQGTSEVQRMIIGEHVTS